MFGVLFLRKHCEVSLVPSVFDSSCSFFKRLLVFFLCFDFTSRFAAIQACEQQLLQFRSLSGSLIRWLQMTQEQLPSKEASLNTEGLQRRVQQLKVCVSQLSLFHLRGY